MQTVLARVILVPLLFASLALVSPLESDAGDKDGRVLKIIAQRSFLHDRDAPPLFGTLVIRSAEELVVASGKDRKAKDPVAAQKDPALQKECHDLVVKALKIEKIDWAKHMVVVFKDNVAYRVPPKLGFGSVMVNGEKVIVTVGPGEGGSWGMVEGTPWAVAVVERSAGKLEVKGLSLK